MLVGDLLTIALVIVAITMPAGPGWVVWVVSVVFLAVYSVGRHRVSVVWRPLDGRGSWWPAQAWAVALLGGYVGMLLASTGAMWLDFPLMLLELHLLGPRRGLFAVGATTLLAILLGATLRGAHGIGYVLIAKRLVVTNATVKSHLAHTYAKLGVQSRTEVIAIARQRGLIS